MQPTPSPDLTWTEDGAPRSSRFGDVYFSRQDGLAESRAVFLEGCGLPHAWNGRRTFTVAELGFGTGLNVAALLDLWRRSAPPHGRLQIFSVEGFPLTAEEAARALSAWPAVAEASAALTAAWPARTPGFHRVDLPEWRATLDLAVGDVHWALSQWRGRADAWFLDGFAPSANPDMWSPAVLDGIVERSAPDARLATFTVAGAVRRGLAERGFQVDKRPGHGRKRERLEARLAGEAPAVAAGPRIAVVGAGIAGAAVVRALSHTDARVTVIEAERPGAGGSGFPAALVTPRMDVGDAEIAALYAQALARAGDLYRAVPDAVLGRGVLQLEQSPRDAVRFARIADQPVWPDGEMVRIDACAAADILSEPLKTSALRIDSALTVSPAVILDAWLGDARVVTGSVARLEPIDEGWRLLDHRGAALIEADVVVLTAGWGSAVLAPSLDLSPVRGQADWIEGATSPAAAWGGYVAPTGSGLLFGATHDRGDAAADVRLDDTRRNRATLAARLPRLAALVDAAPVIHSRAAVRATTPDRLPLAGAVEGSPGLLVLTGLGSRGFCVAPLLGEHVAALATGGSSPLPADLADQVSPSRRAPRRLAQDAPTER